MEMQYKLDIFEGPLDLLLHLIDKDEIDISNIPIARITDQYLAYVNTMQELELEIVSDFLVMAATLLHIKSRMLLPKPPKIDMELEEEEEIDPREELMLKLIEYRKFKEVAEHLKDKELERSLIYSREPIDWSQYAPESTENPLKGIHLADIMIAFSKVLSRVSRRNRVRKIKRDEISVKDRMTGILLLLEQTGGHALFSDLMDDVSGREDLVVAFLAILELMKTKRISCRQHRLFDDIVIEYKGGEVIDESVTDEIDY